MKDPSSAGFITAKSRSEAAFVSLAVDQVFAGIWTAGIKPADEYISRSLYDCNCCQSTNGKRRILHISANRALDILRVDDQHDRRLLIMMKTTDSKTVPSPRGRFPIFGVVHSFNREIPRCLHRGKGEREISCDAECREDAARDLPAPIPDAAAFAEIVDDGIADNPFGCTAVRHRRRRGHGNAGVRAPARPSARPAARPRPRPRRRRPRAGRPTRPRPRSPSRPASGRGASCSPRPRPPPPRRCPRTGP